VRPRLRLLALVTAAALLVFAVGFVARAGPYAQPSGTGNVASTDLPPPPGQPRPDPRGQGADDILGQPGTVDVVPANVVVVVITVALVLGMAGSVLALFGVLPWQRPRPRRSPLRPDPGQLAQREFAAAVEQAGRELDDGPAREAVVACWLLLTRAARRAGSPPYPYETSAEFAARLSAEQLVSEQALLRLAALYREARFSSHAVSAELRAQARRSLGVLQGELTARSGR